MAYLQPWMLWALPAIFLPILIHLLNRLRYKTVHWAAMLFLLKANRAATRRAKIRQYLLLACRALLILFLIWAMARPLVGGWIGAAAGGAPETVLILLDRSASMEEHPAGSPESKRQHALALLSAAAKQNAGSHFVLIENVLRQPLEIAGAAGLATMQMAEGTDTAADLPAMFRAALDYLVKNKPGSAELWVASDLQASNWRADSGEWQDIDARFAGLHQSLRVRVLDLSSAPGRSVSVEVKSADVRVRDEKTGKARLDLVLELASEGERKSAIPLYVTRDGAKSEIDLPLASDRERRSLKFDLPKVGSGWGKAEAPAGDNPADDSAYFVYGPPPAFHTIVIGDGPAATRLGFAAAPDRSRSDRTAETLPVSRAAGLDWTADALVIWAASAPEAAAAKSLESWIQAGGVLLCFPPGAEGGAGPLGIAWGAMETAPVRTPFRVTAWDDLDGPLSRTESGAPLPLARLELLRRQVPSAAGTAHSYGAFADGRSFLIGRKIGAGFVFACAVLPDPAWGNLGEGLVLLPSVQRLVSLGGRRLAPPAMALAGEWKPANPEETWISMETDRRRDWRWHAGVYQNGASKIALNRPEVEDVPETLDRTRLPDLLRGLDLTVMAGALELNANRLQSEIWPAMIIVAMLFMCLEMILATSKAMLPARAAGPTSPPRPVVNPKTVGAHS